MTTNPTTTKTADCPLCGEPKDVTDTRPCAAGRSEVALALRSQPHWLDPGPETSPLMLEAARMAAGESYESIVASRGNR
jgi:hypothetical protein